MLSKEGFNEWAGNYDETISKSSQGYPFEGYYDVLGFVQNSVTIGESTKILDLGIGTGLLTYEIYKKGGEVIGVDFSEKMIEEAYKKMPNGIFYSYDFQDEIISQLYDHQYDYIISSYAIHHVNDERKVDLFKQLSGLLKSGGKIIIADVAFENNHHLNQIRQETGGWDEDEYYIVWEDFQEKLKEKGLQGSYHQISKCAGVIEIK
jgi:putative AdoMet-dependent methyltransferase